MPCNFYYESEKIFFYPNFRYSFILTQLEPFEFIRYLSSLRKILLKVTLRRLALELAIRSNCSLVLSNFMIPGKLFASSSLLKMKMIDFLLPRAV